MAERMRETWMIAASYSEVKLHVVAIIIAA